METTNVWRVAWRLIFGGGETLGRTWVGRAGGGLSTWSGLISSSLVEWLDEASDGGASTSDLLRIDCLITPTPRVQVVFLLLFPRSVIPHSFLLLTMSSSQCPPPTRTKLTSLPPLLHHASTSPPLPGYILTQSTSSCPPHRSHLALRDTGEPHNRPNPYFRPIDSLVRPSPPQPPCPRSPPRKRRR